MKKILLLSLVFLSIYLQSTHAQEKLLGIWEGKIEQAGLSLIFHFEKDSTGNYVSKMDSPDQGAFGIKMDRVVLTENTVQTEMKQFGLSYTGKLTNDSTIEGTLSQGATFPFQLKKKTITSSAKNEKPQTPLAPFPYLTEDIQFNSVEKDIILSGTITKPISNKKSFPAIVLISGSGPQNRDGQIGNHKPFAVLADFFTRNGFLVLRFDERGVGKSTGVFSGATSADFAKDVRGAVNFLSQRDDVNKSQIGLIGHSEGGIIAPMVAAERNDISFMILLAGPGIPVQDLMTEQNVAIFSNAGINAAQADLYGKMYREIIDVIKDAKDTAVVVAQLIPVIEKHVAGMDKQFLNLIKLNTATNINAYAQTMANEMLSPWMHYFLKYNPEPALKKTKAHVLALNGEKDIQVLPTSNLKGIEVALRKGKAKSVTTILLPGLNHLFQKCNTCSAQEYLSLKETFSYEALQKMKEWLSNTIQL